MKIFRFSLLVVLMVGIGPIQGWSAEIQKKSAATLQQQKTMTPLEKQTLQGSSPTVKLECQKAGPGQPPGSPSSGPCAEQGVKVGSQKNIGGSGGTTDVSKSIPGYGASSNLGKGGQSTELVDPRGKKEEAKDKPAGKFEDLSSKGKLEKLMDPNRVDEKGKPTGAMTGAMGELTKGRGGSAVEVGTTTIKPGEGKNTASKQEQQSSEERDPNTGMTQKEAKEEANRQLTGGAPMTQKEAQAEADKQHTGAFKDMAEFNEYAERVKREQAELDRKGSAGGSSGSAGSGTPGGRADRPCVGPLCPQVRGTPNPMADTGSGGGGGKLNPVTGKLYTPAELEAERKRQVTLSNDQKGGQPSRTDLEKTYMSPEEMQKRTLDRMTGGAIDPAEGEGTTPSGGRTSKQTKQPFAGKGPQPGDPSEEILGGTGATTGPSTPSKTGQ